MICSPRRSGALSWRLRARLWAAAVAVAAVSVFPSGVSAHEITPEVERWAPLVEALLRWPDVGRVLHIVACESRGDPEARYMEANGYESVGLVQFQPSTWRKVWEAMGQPAPPRTNAAASLVAMAWIVYDRGGQPASWWTPGGRASPWANWSCHEGPKQYLSPRLRWEALLVL